MAQRAELPVYQWRPPFAPLVLGEYEARPIVEPGETPEQRWSVRCERCGATFRGVCTTGAVRSHIARFAAQHVHSDAFSRGKQG
jgi:hypothetical protein